MRWRFYVNPGNSIFLLARWKQACRSTLLESKAFFLPNLHINTLQAAMCGNRMNRPLGSLKRSCSTWCYVTEESAYRVYVVGPQRTGASPKPPPGVSSLCRLRTVLPVLAQNISSAPSDVETVSGSVGDVGGGIIPSALVSLECPANCEARSTLASDLGASHFAILRLGAISSGGPARRDLKIGFHRQLRSRSISMTRS